MPGKKKKTTLASRKPQQKPKPTNAKRAADVPQLFRLNVEVGNLDAAEKFYSTLLEVQGRRQAGARVYFGCGPVTLQVLDVSSARPPHPAPLQ
jgi:hypothetical protein